MMPMLNKQPREKMLHDNGMLLDVVNVFETIQGEGPFVGTPCVFVRLAGCNLNCELCDTDYTNNRELVSLETLIGLIKGAREQRGLVVLTGGEPYRQNIGPFCTQLSDFGYQVQIETNGTLWRDNLPYGKYYTRDFGYHVKSLTVVCSPKTASISQELSRYVDALKYVMAADYVSEADGLPTKVLGSQNNIARPWPGFRGDIYLQPEDHQDPLLNKRNVDAVLKSCFKYGYRICLQQHKLLGLE